MTPEPLTPPDCDLRGMQHMPLLGERLFTSDFDAHCNDAEWRAGVTLWWRAWQQVPAGSLPNDDGALAGLAGYRRDPRGWLKVKANALRGFVLCSDGRLYHPVICDLAIKAWTKRVSWRRQKAGQRTGQEDGHEGGQSTDVHRGVRADTGADNWVDNKRSRPVKGEGEGDSISEPNGSSIEPAKRKRAGKPLPDDFEMPDDWLEWAVAQGLGRPGAEAERDKFIDSARAHQRRYADWPAAWRYWIRNRGNFNGNARQPAESPIIAGAREALRAIRERGEAVD